jgi:hypothetical protein
LGGDLEWMFQMEFGEFRMEYESVLKREIWDGVWKAIEQKG